MNFKNTWKRANEGFTLVELIVVIAILAILAGIAVPAYSGYIKKANEAADNQVLAAVNTAFAAACLEEGIDFNDVTDARLATTANGETGVTINGVASISGANMPADFSETFMFYLSGPVSTKVINTFDYTPGVGFVKGEGGSGSMTAGQLQAAVDRYNGSNYVGNETALAGSMGSLSAALADQLDANTLNLANWMGGQDNYNAFMEEYGLTEESSGTEKANALIMYTASSTNGVTGQDIMNLAGSDLSNIDKVAETYGEIPTAAMIYGVVTGYANSSYASESVKNAYSNNPTGISDVYALMNQVQNDDNFAAYLSNTGSNGLTADLDGYLAAMEVISGHSDSFDLTDSNAFTNEETMDLLNSILGR